VTPDYLLIDIGNSRTKLALATREGIVEQRDVPTPDLDAASLSGALRDWEFQRVVASSVVPQATGLLESHFSDGLLVLRHDIDWGIRVQYPKPETLGTDRLANAVALAAMHGAPGIAIGFGTAAIFDVVDAERSYIGGVIAPGLRLVTDYLHERTAKLPVVDLQEPASAIGRSTVEAICSGAAFGYRGMVRGILEALRAELGHPPELRVVATGGDAGWIAHGMPEIQVVDADLTLHGLRLVGNLHAPSP